jgi:hypothetical protein
MEELMRAHNCPIIIEMDYFFQAISSGDHRWMLVCIDNVRHEAMQLSHETVDLSYPVGFEGWADIVRNDVGLDAMVIFEDIRLYFTKLLINGGSSTKLCYALENAMDRLWDYMEEHELFDDMPDKP